MKQQHSTDHTPIDRSEGLLQWFYKTRSLVITITEEPFAIEPPQDEPSKEVVFDAGSQDGCAEENAVFGKEMFESHQCRSLGRWRSW